MDVGKVPVLNGYEYSQVLNCVGKLEETKEGTTQAVGNAESGSHSGCK